MILRNLLFRPFHALRSKTFAKLYFGQTISLFGDALTWVGLALLAYQLDKEHSGTILATALTFRVVAYIVFAPFAGVVADKIARKKILVTTHFIRMGIICCLPFINAEWQVYSLVFLLNVFNAFFSPTYRSVIPQVVEKKDYRQAVGLSTATFQLLGVLGPAVAGVVAVWLGARQIFFLDGASFVLAALLILSIPSDELQKGSSVRKNGNSQTLNEVKFGVKLLFSNRYLRFALFVEFVSAIAGGMILVNTIGLVKNSLQLGDNNYGWTMAAFGIGAGVSAFILGSLDKTKTRSLSLLSGAFLLGLSILFANSVTYPVLLTMWVVAGMGQSLAEMPSETLIAENIPSENQGKVFGTHFAFSHLWWAMAYPFAGFLGTTFPQHGFLYGGILTIVFAVVALVVRPKKESFKP